MVRPSLFSDIAHIRPRLILAFVGLHVALKGVFFSAGFVTYIADPVYDLSRGVVTHSTTAGLIEAVILVAFLVFVLRLRASDLGLQRKFLLNGALVTLFIWSVVQTISVAVGRLDDGLLDFGYPWTPRGDLLWAGLLQAHAGGAIIEEVVYRGFLLPQLFLLFVGLKRWTATGSLIAATGLSQLYFAVSHIPAATRGQLGVAEAALYCAEVFFVGVLFVIVYVRTSNLFVAIGLHALLNFPSALFVSRVDPFVLVTIVGSVILIMWPYLNRSLGEVFTLRPASVPSPVRMRT